MAEQRHDTTADQADASRHAALIEARRWANITATQVDAFLRSLDHLGSALPIATNTPALQTYFLHYDRVVENAFFLGSAVTQCVQWLAPAALTVSNEDRGPAKVVGTAAKWWRKQRKAERQALKRRALIHEQALSQSHWLVDDRARFGAVDLSDLRDAGSRLAELLSAALREQ